MRRCASTALILLVGVGAAVSVFGALMSPWLLHGLMKVPEGEVLKLGDIVFHHLRRGAHLPVRL
jgi:hypothetical protein